MIVVDLDHDVRGGIASTPREGDGRTTHSVNGETPKRQCKPWLSLKVATPENEATPRREVG